MKHVEKWNDGLVPTAVVVGPTRFELMPRPSGECWVQGLGKMSLEEIVEYAAQIAAQENRWVAAEAVHVQVIFKEMEVQNV